VQPASRASHPDAMDLQGDTYCLQDDRRYLQADGHYLKDVGSHLQTDCPCLRADGGDVQPSGVQSIGILLRRRPMIPGCSHPAGACKRIVVAFRRSGL
jgi:hypothetical protein